MMTPPLGALVCTLLVYVAMSFLSFLHWYSKIYYNITSDS